MNLPHGVIEFQMNLNDLVIALKLIEFQIHEGQPKWPQQEIQPTQVSFLNREQHFTYT